MISTNATTPAARTFFRIVLTDPPTLRDFLSYEELGIRVGGDDPEAARLRQGISVNATEAQARRRARGMPRLGRYIAELTIPADSPIRFERTTKSAGHYTLWGDPATLMGCVRRVVPV